MVLIHKSLDSHCVLRSHSTFKIGNDKNTVRCSTTYRLTRMQVIVCRQATDCWGSSPEKQLSFDPAVEEKLLKMEKKTKKPTFNVSAAGITLSALLSTMAACPAAVHTINWLILCNAGKLIKLTGFSVKLYNCLVIILYTVKYTHILFKFFYYEHLHTHAHTPCSVTIWFFLH